MRIAVLSRNGNLYSTRRLMEAGEKRGHEMLLLDYLKCKMLIEKHNVRIYYEQKPLKNIDAIIPRIGASRTFYGSAVVRQFEMMNVFTAVSSQAIVRARDKLRSMQILAQNGIGMPVTAFASGPEHISFILKKVGGPPFIMKLLEGTQGKGVMLAESASAAKSALDAFFGLKVNILLQEYIEEAKGSDIRVIVVGGKVVGSMKRTGAHGDFRSNLHMGGSAKNIQLTKVEKSTAIEAAKALGLTVAGVDMLQSNRGPLVMEVNSSPGLEGIETSTKIDIAGKIIDFIVDQFGKPLKDRIGH
jgi:ribosomal protein S6--L-glutamate ligase